MASTSLTKGTVLIAPASSSYAPSLRWLSTGGSFGSGGSSTQVLGVYRLSLLPRLTLTLRVILRGSGDSDTVILAS
jgi:hypothetical protein